MGYMPPLGLMVLAGTGLFFIYDAFCIIKMKASWIFGNDVILVELALLYDIKKME